MSGRATTTSQVGSFGRGLMLPFALIVVVVVLLASIRLAGGGFASAVELRLPEGDGWLGRQASYSRVFRPTGYSLVWSASQAAEPFYGILRLKVDRRGRVYVADHGDLRVKALDEHGAPGPVFGNGRGQGPGELTFLNDLQITDRGEVWISDMANGRVNIYSPEGELRRTITTEEVPYRLVVDAQGKGFVSLMIVHSETLLATFDGTGKVVSRAGRVLQDQAKRSLAFDGWIEDDGEGGVVYAGLYGGVLARYHANGSPLFVMQTMDRRRLPKLLIRDGSIWIDQEAPVSTATLSVTNAGIHLLTYYRDGLVTRKVIDTYDRDDGSYLYSRPVPEDCPWLVQTEGHLYTVGRDLSVKKWAMVDRS